MANRHASPAQGTRLLELDTLVSRPHIEVDGQRIEMLNPEEMSVIDNHRFGVWGAELERLQADASEEAGEELARLVARVARDILPGCPDELFARLSGVQQMAVIEVFIGLRLSARLRLTGAVRTAAENPPTGAK